MQFTSPLFAILALGATMAAAAPAAVQNPNDLQPGTNQPNVPIIGPRDAEAEAEPKFGWLGKLSKINPFKAKDPVPGSPAALAKWRNQ